MTVKQNKALVSYGGRSYPAAAEGVYIWGGGGGGGAVQKDDNIHTHTRLHNLGYAIKTMEMYQRSDLVDHTNHIEVYRKLLFQLWNRKIDLKD